MHAGIVTCCKGLVCEEEKHVASGNAPASGNRAARSFLCRAFSIVISADLPKIEWKGTPVDRGENVSDTGRAHVPVPEMHGFPTAQLNNYRMINYISCMDNAKKVTR